MATDDRQVLVAGQASAPARYIIPGNGQIRPKVIFAKFDGTATSTAYQPAIKLTSDGGETVGIFPTLTSVTAGGSVSVSWFPGVDQDDGTAVTPATSGAIKDIISPGATLSVTAPTGPTTLLDLPLTGVGAGSYGDASHSTAITVDGEGRITAAASVGIAGGSGTIGFEIGYDQITAFAAIGSTNEAAPTTLITCSANTFDGAPVLLSFYTPFVQGPNTGAIVGIALWEGVTEITRLGIVSTSAVNQLDIATTMQFRFTPAVGVHTYLIRGYAASLAGTPGIGAGTGSGANYPPAFARFTKV